MRTKTLLLTAALSAAGIATSQAQAVYSVNAVGYVNTTLVKGYNLISNPLDNKATGGNQIKNLFATLPEGSQIFKFDPATAKYDLASVEFGEVTGTIADQELKPGEGVFINAAAAGTITFVGEVPAGQLSNTVPKGLSIKSSQVPQAGTATALAFPAGDGDQVFKFDEATQKFTSHIYDFGAWDTEPTLDVGEALFVNAAAQRTWARNFVINQ
jgi:hypothetical protein